MSSNQCAYLLVFVVPAPRRVADHLAGMPVLPVLVADRPRVGAARAAAAKGGRAEKWPRRLVCDAIFYLVRGGIAWAQLPHDFPPAKTIYRT